MSEKTTSKKENKIMDKMELLKKKIQAVLDETETNLEFKEVPYSGTIVAAMQYPDANDSHLWVVLARVDANLESDIDHFVVWNYNSQTFDYTNGDYFTCGTAKENREGAYQTFSKRVSDISNKYAWMHSLS